MPENLPYLKPPAFSPSGIKRAFICPASVDLIRRTEYGPSSVYAIEGNRAHALAEWALTERESPEDVEAMAGQSFTCAGRNPDEFVVPDDMAEAVALYVDFVYSVAGTTGKIEVEKRYTAQIKGVEIRAYADCVITLPNVVHIIDYKHGAGVPVSAADNLQLAMYGALECLNSDAYVDNKQINLSIVQPRSWRNKIQTWEAGKAKAFGRHYDKFFSDVIDKALAPDPHFKISDECGWCRGLLICPEVRNAVEQLAKADSMNIYKLTGDEVDGLLSKAGACRSYLQALEQNVKDRLRSGEKVGKRKLVVTTRNYKKWIAEKDVLHFLERVVLLTAGEVTTRQLKTVAAIEKVLKKEKLSDEEWERFRSLVAVDVKSYETIVDDDDPRPAVSTIEDDYKDE